MIGHHYAHLKSGAFSLDMSIYIYALVLEQEHNFIGGGGGRQNFDRGREVGAKGEGSGGKGGGKWGLGTPVHPLYIMYSVNFGIKILRVAVFVKIPFQHIN